MAIKSTNGLLQRTKSRNGGHDVVGEKQKSLCPAKIAACKWEW